MPGYTHRRTMPNRRTVLKCCALATTLPLAGCLGDAEPGADQQSTTPANTPTPPATDTRTPHPTQNATTGALPGGNDTDAGGTRLRGTGGPGVTLVGTDDQASPVELVREVATSGAPPRLRVSITNVGDESHSVGEGRAVVFAYRHDTAKQLVLLPADGTYPAEPGCWRLTDGIAVTEEYRTVTLAPGQTVARSLDLYGAVGEDACLPVGEFRFETTYQVRPAADGTALSDDEAATYSWGFTVLME